METNDKNIELIRDSLAAIAAKAGALHIDADRATVETIDRLMREIISEAQYIKSRAYQIRREDFKVAHGY